MKALYACDKKFQVGALNREEAELKINGDKGGFHPFMRALSKYQLSTYCVYFFSHGWRPLLPGS